MVWMVVSMVAWEEFLPFRVNAQSQTTIALPCVPMLYLEQKSTFLYVANYLFDLAPRAGFEPATNRLTADEAFRVSIRGSNGKFTK
jgi:hypothetical protein